MQEPFRDRGSFRTERASQYLAQLCKHFAHKIAVTYDDRQGEISFPFGKAELEATEGALVARLDTGSEEELVRGRQVIDDHLRRFAFRESFQSMAWDSQA